MRKEKQEKRKKEHKIRKWMGKGWAKAERGTPAPRGVLSPSQRSYISQIYKKTLGKILRLSWVYLKL